MQIKTVEFQFKGARDYIQGPDIFNAMLAVGRQALPSVSRLRFSVHGFVHTPVCQVFAGCGKEELAAMENISARCQLGGQGQEYWLALAPHAGDARSGARGAYDEDKVTSICQRDGDAIRLQKPSPFSFIETVVSMNKYLHQQHFPDALGKWIFTAINLDEYCDRQDGLALKIRHNMNYRLTKTDVLVDGRKIGELFFSLVKP